MLKGPCHGGTCAMELCAGQPSVRTRVGCPTGMELQDVVGDRQVVLTVARGVRGRGPFAGGAELGL